MTIDISHSIGNTEASLNSPFFNGNGQHVELSQSSFGLDYRLPLPGSNAFWGAQGRVFLGPGSGKEMNLDIHPTAGEDTFIRLQERISAMIYAGMTVASIEQYNLALILGARATQSRITGSTDESGGGGWREEFSDNELRIQPSVIAELTGPACESFTSRWRAGIALDHTNDHSVSGQSSTFGFNYGFATDSEWQVRTFFGLIY